MPNLVVLVSRSNDVDLNRGSPEIREHGALLLACGSWQTPKTRFPHVSMPNLVVLGQTVWVCVGSQLSRDKGVADLLKTRPSLYDGLPLPNLIDVGQNW